MTTIAYDADIPYDSDIWFYDGGPVRWSAAPSESAARVSLTEAVVGGATLAETLIGRSTNTMAAGAGALTETSGQATVSDE